MTKGKVELTDAEKAQQLMDLIDRAYASEYVQSHSDMRQMLLKEAKQLDDHPKSYNQVAFALRTAILDLTLDGGVKSVDPALDELGWAVTQIANGKIGQPGGWATMFYGTK